MSVRIETRHDQKRGCGYRKPGGLYLVCSGYGRPCGRLPHALERCLCCGAGVKYCRGWTWINTKLLFGAVPCPREGVAPGCGKCPARPEVLGPAGLIWVGEKFYNTPHLFTEEAAAQGISRRVAALPLNFKLGETWIWLAHIRAITCGDCKGAGGLQTGLQQAMDAGGKAKLVKCTRCKGTGHTAGIFHAFKPEAVEYVVTGKETEEQLHKLLERGITPIKVVHDAPLATAGEE